MQQIDSIRDGLLAYIRREFRSASLRADEPLLEGLVDSVGLFNLVGFIETSYGVVLDDADLTVEHFASVDSITALLAARLAAPTVAS